MLDEAPTKVVARSNGSQYTNGLSSSNGAAHRNGTQNHPRVKPKEKDLPESVVEKKLFVFSAKSAASLDALLPAFVEYLAKSRRSSDFMNHLSYTLGQKRTLFNHRVAVMAESLSSLKDQLAALPAASRAVTSKAQTVALAFTGQGAQYSQMGAGLEKYEAFSEAMTEAENLLREFGASWSLRDELNKADHSSQINKPEISQPACTAVQLALVALLQTWGISPAAVVGHSSGEIAAAYASGFVSFRAAMGISFFRGVAVSQIVRDRSASGAMLALGVSAEQATTLINNQEGYATIAAYNSTGSVTISGDADAIECIEEAAKSQNMFSRRLRVDVAYHSAHMEKVAASYLAAIKPLCTDFDQTLIVDAATRPAFLSSVTGKKESYSPSMATYWVKNLVSPVLYTQAVTALVSPGTKDEKATLADVIIEVGPHCALKNPTMQIVAETGLSGQAQATYSASLMRGTDAATAMLDLGSKLFISGANLHLGQVNKTTSSSCCVVTDLPPYEWVKSTRYLHQSRMTHERLFNGTAYHYLLGWKSPSQGSEHTFRNVFTINDIPWLRGHEIDGQVLFPFTGFISLATAAFASVCRSDPASILIQEIHVRKSLRIEEEQTTEIMTKLRPSKKGTGGSSETTWDFEIMSWSEAHGWVVHAFGQVEADQSHGLLSSPNVHMAYDVLGDSSLEERDTLGEYAALRKSGYRYGPDFANMVELRTRLNFTVHAFDIREWDASMSPATSQVTVDPPTLDTCLHSFGITQASSGPRATYVPTHIRKWRICNRITAGPGCKLHVVTRLLDSEPRQAGTIYMSFIVFDFSETVPKPVLEVDTMVFKAISKPSNEDLALNFPTTFETNYVPVVNFIDGEALSSMVAESVALLPAEKAQELRHRQYLFDVVHQFLCTMLKETENDDKGHLPSHLQNFEKWAKLCVRRFPVTDESFDPAAFLADVPNHNAMDQMICAVGQQLTSIMRGKIQPLEVMLPGGLLSRSYEEDQQSIRMNKGLAAYVQHQARYNPDLKILEIGGGTASAAVPIFEAIEKATKGTTSFFQYMFTDISSGFFEDAQRKLSRWSEHGRISYRKLDIGQDPVAQGFEPESYDLVVAANVLHATPDISVTLRNVWSLLKDDGKLALLELTQSVIPPTLPFALLPGWWLANDGYRSPNGPLLSAQGWSTALKSSGFSGVEGRVTDHPGQPEENYAVMWSSKLPETISSSNNDAARVTICTNEGTSGTTSFLEALQCETVRRLGLPSTVQSLLGARPDGLTFCIILDNPRHSILKGLSAPQFNALKDVICRSRGLLWVSPEDAEPEAAMIKGFLRGLRLEDSSKGLFLLENIPYTATGAQSVLEVSQHLLWASSKPGVRRDQEFALIDGVIRAPRLEARAAAAEAFAAEAGLATRQASKIRDHPCALEMTIETVGNPDSVYFRNTDALSAEPIGSEVVVRVEAAGVNFRDLLLVLGSVPWEAPGLEGAGIVVGVGPVAAEDGFRVGDRVLYIGTQRGWSTYIKTDAEHVHKIPGYLDAAEAAGMPIVYCTAIHSLIEVGRLQKGESVLIHAASGGVGQACIMLAQHIGARIFCTAGTEEKREFLANTYGIPPTHIFSSRTPAFRDSIMLATKGHGVDVIVNSLSGHLLQQSWELIADNGRFVELGKNDFTQNNYLPMRLFEKNVTFCGFNLWKRWNTVPGSTKVDLAAMFKLFRETSVGKVGPLTRIPVSQIATGLRKLQSGQNIGKIVITMDPDDVVQAERPSLLGGTILHPDRTYVISGGTGGLGRSLAAWMVKQGAKNIVLLGRSAQSNPKVAQLLERYEETDVCVRALACDVGCRHDVERASQVIADMPRVGGVIHGALYLRVSKI